MYKRLLAAVGLLLWALPLFGQPVLETSFDLTRLAPDLKEPVSLFADSVGGFWVGDAKNKRLFSFAPDGTVRAVLGDKKKNKIGYPMDLAADRSGRIYVLDSQERIVLIFDPSGERREQLGGSKTFARPIAITLDDSDNVYVVDEGRKKISTFDSFKRPTYNLESAAGRPLQRPTAVAADRQGDIFVLDAGRRSVLVYDGSRQLKQEISLSSEGRDFSRPVDLAAAPSGELFLLEAAEPAVWYLPAWRTPVWKKILGGEKAGTKPTGLALNGEGKLFVLDPGTMEVRKYRVSGLTEAAPASEAGGPAAGLKRFATSLGDSGRLLVPYVNYRKGIALLQPFDSTGNLADWVLDSDIRLKIGGEPTTFSAPISLSKSDLKLAIALVWAIGGLSAEGREELKNAVVQQIYPELDEPNDKLFIFTAGDRPEAALEMEGNTHTAEAALRNLPTSSGGLCYYDAILKADERLKERAPGLLPVIILLADGRDRSSSAAYLDIARRADEKGFANIYVVAYDDGQKGGHLSDLRRLSETTQGIYFETGEPKNFSQIFARVIKALKYQLVVRFSPPSRTGELFAEVKLENKTLSATSSKSWAKPVYEEKEMAQSSGPWKTAAWAAGGVVLLTVGIFGFLFFFKKRSRKCPVCGHPIERSWSSCYFCKAPLLVQAKGPKRQAAVTVQKGRLAGMRFPLNEPVITIGSSKDNVIVVDYEGISRKHARLEKNGGRWEIVDLNSTNHTYLNGKPISRSALKSKDVISLGRVADLIFEG